MNWKGLQWVHFKHQLNQLINFEQKSQFVSEGSNFREISKGVNIVSKILLVTTSWQRNTFLQSAQEDVRFPNNKEHSCSFYAMLKLFLTVFY